MEAKAPATKGKDNEKGIALFIVLWVLTILMVIVLSFSFTTKTETRSTLAFKEGIERKFLAEAGINRAVMELFYRKQYLASVDVEVWKIDGTTYNGEVGDGFYDVSITDESGKVDINTVSEVILKNILINSGIKDEDADIIVDSIMDWKDADDLHRLHGAESDYYMSLPNPYKAKDANFDTVEELLLVKGVTSSLLYGSGGKKGIIDILTVNSKNKLININAAPREVLTAIPGVTPEIADSILSQRAVKEIKNMQEVQGISSETASQISQNARLDGSNTFTIEAKGYRADKNKGYSIKATVNILGNNRYNYIYYKGPINTNR